METYEGYIKYNDDKKCYGMIGHDGSWIKEALEDGARVDVAINGEQFATNFIKEYPYSPVLKPHVWNNWKFLTTVPATYYKFEEKSPTNAEKKRSRYEHALFLIGISLVVSTILGSIFALIGMVEESYWDAFLITFNYFFWLCGAGMVVSGILMIINILPEDLCIGFGCALYYGTIILAATLLKSIPGSDRYFISFTIVALVCYIVWLKKFKATNTD